MSGCGLALVSCNGGTPPPPSAPALAPISTVAFEMQAGTSQIRDVVLRNTGTAPLTYRLSIPETPWLSVANGLTGQIPAGEAGNAQFTAKCGAEPGLFQGSAIVTADGLPPMIIQTTLTCTEAPDTTPDPFTFSPVTTAPAASQVTSNTVTLTGLNASAPISLSGGELIVNGQTFTGTAVKNGDTIAVRVRAPQAGETLTTTLTIGGYTTTFVVSLAAPNTTPTPFSFRDVIGVQPSTLVTSNAVTITGITAPAPITLTGAGTLVVNGQEFTGSTVNVGDVVAIRVPAPEHGSTVTSTLTVGGYAALFRVTSAPAPDSTPDPFSFQPVTDARPGTEVISNTVTITGINVPTEVTILGTGTLVVNGQALDGNKVNNGDTVALRIPAPAYGSSTTAALLVGNYRAEFTVSSVPEPDTTPDPFVFQNITDVPAYTRVISNTVTITGINTPTPIEMWGYGRIIVNGQVAAYQGTTVKSGDTLAIESISGLAGTTRTANVIVGTYSTTFSVTTQASSGLRLYQLNDYTGVKSEVPIPYSISKTIVETIPENSAMSVGRYTLTATNHDFQLRNLQFKDSAGGNAGELNGLYESMVIHAGTSVDFIVIANRTFGQRKKIVVSFDAVGLGRQFTIDLDLETN